jgi:hypothetical protein
MTMCLGPGATTWWGAGWSSGAACTTIGAPAGDSVMLGGAIVGPGAAMPCTAGGNAAGPG